MCLINVFTAKIKLLSCSHCNTDFAVVDGGSITEKSNGIASGPFQVSFCRPAPANSKTEEASILLLRRFEFTLYWDRPKYTRSNSDTCSDRVGLYEQVQMSSTAHVHS